MCYTEIRSLNYKRIEVIIINKYKDTYKVYQTKDNKGKPSSNKDDTYLKAYRNVVIYRYNSNTLAILFYTKQYAKNRISDLLNIGVTLKPFQIGDDEGVYLFAESDLSKLVDIVHAKKRIKRDLTDEQREVLRQRMLSLKKNDM